MVDRKPASSRWHKPFQWAVVAFAAVGTVLGAVALVVVWQTMEGVRAEIRRMMAASDDPAFVAATQAALDHEWMVSFGILVAIVLVAAFNIAAGLIVLKRDWKTT